MTQQMNLYGFREAIPATESVVTGTTFSERRRDAACGRGDRVTGCRSLRLRLTRSVGLRPQVSDPLASPCARMYLYHHTNVASIVPAVVDEECRPAAAAAGYLF